VANFFLEEKLPERARPRPPFDDESEEPLRTAFKLFFAEDLLGEGLFLGLAGGEWATTSESTVAPYFCV